MHTITLDFESYWDTDYSLSKLSPLEYVLGDRWQTISCAVKVNSAPTKVYFGHDDVAAALGRLDIANSALLAHNNSGFDCYVSAYRYGLKPKVWLCTLAMARPEHAKTTGLSLARLVKHYGLGTKNNAALMQTKGKRLEDFTAQEIADMRVYNCEDTDQCYALFNKLQVGFTANELWQIDATIRMRTEPAFELDNELLESTLAQERADKREALRSLADLLGLGAQANDRNEQIELVRERLASAPKFVELLKARGVDAPMKPSPTNPEKEVPALAKTDEAFIALQDHEDPVVAAAARTRLSVKSTLLETRVQKFQTAGRLAGGKLPVPIRYYGADTTGRDSGEEYNMLNLPRVNKKKPRNADALRNSLRAPKGKVVIVADQSNIELRINHTLWKVQSSMALWAQDPVADLYRAAAAVALGCAPEDVTPDQRQVEKIKQLGLGFGAGVETFRRVAKTMGGIDMSPVYVDGKFVRDPAQEAVDDWRMRYSRIVRGWRTCHDRLRAIEAGQVLAIDPWGLTHTCKEGVRLPDGRVIRYPDLRQEADATTGAEEWVYAHGRHKARIYAGKITENCVQALARSTIADSTLKFFRQTGLRPVVRPYDELVYIVDEERAEALLHALQTIMRTPPKWWPQLVVWSEGGIGETYGAAK